MVKTNEEQIKAMRRLGMTEEEIQDVLQCDKEIDRGKRMDFDLDKETEKMAKKYCNVGTRKTPTKTEPKKRKENPTKAGIISEIAKFLAENSENACENVNITNAERQIAFTIGEISYEFTLVQKRKPKN
jgi:hypothetical protein